MGENYADLLRKELHAFKEDIPLETPLHINFQHERAPRIAVDTRQYLTDQFPN
jgi:hypothetical protein